MDATTEPVRKSLAKSDLPAVEVSASPRDKFEEFLATRGLRRPSTGSPGRIRALSCTGPGGEVSTWSRIATAARTALVLGRYIVSCILSPLTGLPRTYDAMESGCRLRPPDG